MHGAADRGAFWDTGDDRSQVFAPVANATTLPLKGAAAPLPRDLSRFAANEEAAAATLFLRSAMRATG